MTSFALPRNLADAVTLEDDEGRRTWLTTLPATLAHFEQRWSLRVGEPFQPGGQTAWVAPARSDAGGDLVLKLAGPHEEATHEAEGLRAWDGQGAVLVHAADDLGGTTVLLLERCVPGNTLVIPARTRAGHHRCIASTAALARARSVWASVPPAAGDVRSMGGCVRAQGRSSTDESRLRPGP